jgi:non-heme chloroperoxidase
MPFLTTQNNVQIFYRDWGAGRPVVLIHGWPLSGDMWEKQATFLAENGFRVICYDRRGFGRSDQPGGGYDYDTLTADLATLMEKLDLHDAALVGFSMGGGEVARYLSRKKSNRVTRAVLVSAVTPFLMKTAENPDGLDRKVFEKNTEAIRKDRFDFLRDFAPKFYGRSALKHTVSEAELEWTFAMAITGSLPATLQTAQSWSSTDFRDDLRQITIPVLVIHGTSDETVPIDASGRRTAKLLPNAELREYAGEPHGLFRTAADRLNEELVKFLSVRRADMVESRAAVSNPRVA